MSLNHQEMFSQVYVGIPVRNLLINNPFALFPHSLGAAFRCVIELSDRTMYSGDFSYTFFLCFVYTTPSLESNVLLQSFLGLDSDFS